MRKDQAQLAESPAMTEALDWLSQKAEDPLDELVPLRRHLRNILSLPLQPLVLLRLLDLFEPRITNIHKQIMPLLQDAATPLPRNLRVISQSLNDLHGSLAEGFTQVIQQAVGDGFQRPKRRRETLAERALISLRRQYELTLRTASGTPSDFWQRIGALVNALPGTMDTSQTDTTQRLLKQILAIHAAQAEALAPREQDYLWQQMEQLAPLVEISALPPKKAECWLWMDTHDERAPTPANRRAPPAADGLMFYTCRKLGQLIQASLDNLTAPTPNRGVLHHAAQRWLNPPQRRHNRRRGNYRIEVCPRLSSLWSLLHGDVPETAAKHAITEWQVMNDSPAGYAAMHIAGSMPSLLPGSVIGIRRNEHEPWSLCMVRWVRSENTEHLEIGLEVLAPHAEAVRIASNTRPEGPTPALLLPPMNAAHRGETLLTERGTYETGRVAMLHESKGRFQVVECQPQPLVVQTSSIELFEFERVHHPAA